MAMPRVAMPGGAGVTMPRPLPPSQASLLRRIFALQSSGAIPAALRASETLDTSVPLVGEMLGHVLAQRYLGPYTRPGADQLRAWLERYSDQPDAAAIRRLLVVRMPAGQSAPPLPEGFVAAEAGAPAPVPEESEASDAMLARNSELDRSVWATARSRGAAGVERLLRSTDGLSPSYASQLRGEAAQIMFTLNRDDEAFSLASAGVPVLHLPAPSAIAGLAGGLAAWRTGRIDEARALFAAGWRSALTTPSMKAACAYWTARSTMRAGGGAAAADRWLRRAGEQRRTFYGMIARRALGLSIGFSRVGPGERETLGEADVTAVAELPQGRRALALLQIDQPGRAEAELRLLWPLARESRPLARAAMLVAEAAGFSDLSMQYADLMATLDGRPREGLRFPVPKLRPAGGFRVDPALLYGLARTESDFDAKLVSSAGARGLLQIMPETANFITGSGKSVDGETLDDPSINLELGQRYMTWLAAQDMVRGNLIKLLASYNAGPGMIAKWDGQIRDGGDPLLYIEAIPIDETRMHVPRVLTYSWIYATRMHLPTTSLDDLAAAEWPRFQALAQAPTPDKQSADKPELASLH